MKAIVLATLYEIGESHKQSILMRAEDAKFLNLISELPKLSTKKGSLGRFLVIIEFPESDYAFWMGFYLGKDFVMNNRDIFIAKE